MCNVKALVTRIFFVSPLSSLRDILSNNKISRSERKECLLIQFKRKPLDIASCKKETWRDRLVFVAQSRESEFAHGRRHPAGIPFLSVFFFFSGCIAYDQTRRKICAMQRRDGDGSVHLDASENEQRIPNKHAWPRDNKISCAPTTKGEGRANAYVAASDVLIRSARVLAFTMKTEVVATTQKLPRAGYP